MEYLVKSLSPKISIGESKSNLAKEIQGVIQQYADQGWEYVGIEHLTSRVNGNSGCFGLGATPGYDIQIQLLIFRK